MSNNATVRKEGIVQEALPGATFRVRTDDGQELLAHLSGRMRVYRIRIIPGDRVIVELPSADAERGRIVYRK